MSRIGKKPIPIPKGVTVTVKDHAVTVKGPKGELRQTVHPAIGVEVRGQEIVCTRATDAKQERALHGLWRALIHNMVVGVTDGYQQKLEIVGVGYRAEMKGSRLNLNIGYSHPILFAPPEGIKIETPSQTTITISGIDKQLVGQVAAEIRGYRPPEPYKGKGVRYAGEFVRRKEGKKK